MVNVIKEVRNKAKVTPLQSSPINKHENNSPKASHVTQDGTTFAAMRWETLTVLRRTTDSSLHVWSGKSHTTTSRNTKGRQAFQGEENVHRTL